MMLRLSFPRQYVVTTPTMIILILSMILVHLSYVSTQCGSMTPDRQDKLALYKVILRTYWSRARFPRHYPEWRPPAQFGKLIGRTHDSTYSLYRLGERLTPGATQYVETGRTDGLDTGGDSANILDAFGAPGVPQGEGTTVSRAFLDGNHTVVSVMARINPSPDWFIGVDSFQLCVEGNWVDTVTVELDPLDGGTDNGFTFTAANWPTNPQGIAYRITSKYPAHPAGSFYYPNLPRLPPIATITFTKLKEYTLTETYHEDEVEMEFVSSEKQLQSYDVTPRGIDPNRELNEAIAEERREMDNQRYRYWTTGSSSSASSSSSSSSAPSSSSSDDLENNKLAIINSIASSYGNYGQSRSRLSSTPTPFSRLANSQENKSKQEATLYKSADALVEAQKAQIYEDIQRRIANVTNSSLNRRIWRNNSSVINNRERQHKLRIKHHRYSTKGKRFRARISRDCTVGDWGAWSACSRSCGVGETQRTRKVTVRPRRGGKQCPPLKETKWCGSVTPCHENTAKPIVDFFSW